MNNGYSMQLLFYSVTLNKSDVESCILLLYVLYQQESSTVRYCGLPHLTPHAIVPQSHSSPQLPSLPCHTLLPSSPISLISLLTLVLQSPSSHSLSSLPCLLYLPCLPHHTTTVSSEISVPLCLLVYRGVGNLRKLETGKFQISGISITTLHHITTHIIFGTQTCNTVSFYIPNSLTAC